MPTQKELLESIVDRLDKLESQPVPAVVKSVEVKSEAGLDDVLDGPSDIVPSPYRAAVDSSLNKSFGVHLKGLGGNFKFTILVPEKYSTLNEEQKKLLKVDQRPKVLDNVEGENGVKLWADRVFGSFNPAVQAQIVADRTAEM